mgnify:CR=1 FL=1
MLTIEQALDEAYKNAGSNAYFGNGFRAGIEFAQRWISVEDELPDIGKEVLVKRELRQGDTWVQHFCSVSTRLTPSGEWEDIKWSDVGFIRGIVTHWRPIELKL